MPSPRGALLIQYRYDPLDRLLDCSPTGLPSHQRFYQKNRLATEIHGQLKHAFFQAQDILLAQQQHPGTTTDTTLLATDLQRSVLHTVEKTQQSAIAYMPYGHRTVANGLLSLLGFNGELVDPVTGHYLLGNGYRAFNPVLMRFNSPDSLSPFGKGGLNAYAYCMGDPVNYSDSSGHIGAWPLIKISLFKIRKTPKAVAVVKPVRRLDVPRGATEPPPALKPNGEYLDNIGFHGSTAEQGDSLTGGLNPAFMNSAGGLSSGKGFYVAPKMQTAIDFSEVAASYTESGIPRVYRVYVDKFESMIPGVHYRFGTMGEGGLVHRSLNEMEIVLRERIYRRVSITALDIRKKDLVLPRASEAPF